MSYKELLSNEMFVLDVPGYGLPEINNYRMITDLGFLYEENVRIVEMLSGLGDQCCYYLLGRMLTEKAGAKVYYNDLRCSAFNGEEVHKLATKEMNFISEHLNEKLSCEASEKSLANLLFQNGYQKICMVVTDSRRLNGIYEEKMDKYYVASDYAAMLEFRYGIPWYDCLTRIEDWSCREKIKLSEYFKFPTFAKTEHIALCNEMQSCDSVVVHVRRGDYVSWGWNVDNEFYVEAIQKVMQIREYKNKKFFVFSDDLFWCREHCEELGLDQVGACEVRFVEGNKGEESFRDMQLMSFGKIMIISASYFPKMAAMLSESVEMVLCSHETFLEAYEMGIRKNRYKVGTYTRDYKINRNMRKPKQD